jgi:hypothetical protein
MAYNIWPAAVPPYDGLAGGLYGGVDNKPLLAAIFLFSAVRSLAILVLLNEYLSSYLIAR